MSIKFILIYNFVLLSILNVTCKKQMESLTQDNPTQENKETIKNALPSAPIANAAIVSIDVDPSTIGSPISDNFAGLSFATNIMQKRPNHFNPNTNATFIQLIKNLGQNGIFRIGGSASDETIWTGKERLPGDGIDKLTTTDIDLLVGVTKSIGWPVLFGVNLGVLNDISPNADPKLKNCYMAVDLAKYVMQKLGNDLYAFQFGNEPDLFKGNGKRAVDYKYLQFKAEWDRYKDTFYKVFGNSIPIAGPDVSRNASSWVVSMADEPNVKLLTAHFYRAHTKDPDIHIDSILTFGSGPRFSMALNTYKNTIASYHIPFRISEGNTIAGGGKEGISDTYASALWVLDFMWNIAYINGQGVNLHTGNASYSPIGEINGIAVPRPEYYGILTFVNAGTKGGKILPNTKVNVTTKLRTTGLYRTTGYACINNGKTYVTLINSDYENLSYTVNLTNKANSMKIARLEAPAINAKTDITFAGTKVNADGTYVMGKQEEYAVGNNSVIVNVPAYSAAVITFE